jgi:hypothetical protein
MNPALSKRKSEPRWVLSRSPHDVILVTVKIRGSFFDKVCGPDGGLRVRDVQERKMK